MKRFYNTTTKPHAIVTILLLPLFYYNSYHHSYTATAGAQTTTITTVAATSTTPHNYLLPHNYQQYGSRGHYNTNIKIHQDRSRRSLFRVRLFYVQSYRLIKTDQDESFRRYPVICNFQDRSRQIKTNQDVNPSLICLDLSFSCIFVVKTPDFFTSG